MVEFWYLDPFPRFRKKMFALTVFILAFLSTFQNSICQSGYNYPQNVGRQLNPVTGQQVDANGNPIMQGGGQGQPVGGQQQPIMPTTGNMPAMGGNQQPPQNTMPNQQIPQQNQGGAFGAPNQQPQIPQNQFPTSNQQIPQNQFPGSNQQFPQNQFPGSNQQFPQNQFPVSNQQFPQNQFPVSNQQFPQNQFPGAGQQYPGPIQHYPNQYPGGHSNYPEPPHDLHLSPDGQFAYGYIMHEIASMLNRPTSRNNLFMLFNNLETVLDSPKSGPIIQEFFNRWQRAIDPSVQTGTYPTNVVVQNPSSSFFDTLKRKGNALVNLAKDVTMAKTKALNSLFDDSIFSPAVQIGTNWANAGMQGIQGTVSPLIGTTGNTGGQIIPVTTPQVTVQA